METCLHLQDQCGVFVVMALVTTNLGVGWKLGGGVFDAHMLQQSGTFTSHFVGVGDFRLAVVIFNRSHGGCPCMPVAHCCDSDNLKKTTLGGHEHGNGASASYVWHHMIVLAHAATWCGDPRCFGAWRAGSGYEAGVTLTNHACQ